MSHVALRVDDPLEVGSLRHRLVRAGSHPSTHARTHALMDGWAQSKSGSASHIYSDVSAAESGRKGFVSGVWVVRNTGAEVMQAHTRLKPTTFGWCSCECTNTSLITFLSTCSGSYSRVAWCACLYV